MSKLINAAREELLRLDTVMAEVPLSKSGIYTLIRQGKFPRPVKLTGKAVAWRRSAIEDWKQSRQETEPPVETQAPARRERMRFSMPHL